MEEKIQEFEGVKFKLVLTSYSDDGCYSGTFGHSSSLTIKDLIKINNGLEEVIGEFSKTVHHRGIHGKITEVEYKGRTLSSNKEIHIKRRSEDYLFDTKTVLWESVIY